MKPFRPCLLLLAAAVFLVAGCRGTGTTTAASADPVPVAFGSIDGLPTDPFDLNAADVSGEILTIKVSFSGGCRYHEFVLTAATFFLESDPVQLPMALTHDDNGDTCEAYPTENRRFDLSPIKERYRSAYGLDSGSIRLILHPAPNSGQPLAYEF